MGFMIEHWDFSTPIATQEATTSQEIKAKHWYHCERLHPDIRGWLEHNQVPKATVDHLLADESRPSFHPLDDENFMLILRGINMNENASPEDMLSIRILYFQGALISTRKIPSRAIMEIRQALAEQKGPKSLASLLNQIIEGLNGKIDLYLDTIEETLNHFDVNDESTYKHISAQKALISIKRFIRPQQYAIRDLLESSSDLVVSRPHQYRFAHNNITRINETIDFYLGEVALFQEEIKHNRDEKTNKNSYLFTLVATIFLPTSFLTGLLGINIGGMPGVDSATAFTWFCVALIIIFTLEWLLLKRFGLTNKSDDE
ncbi:zinc transporter ZntB [Vibrio natriegens]|uniref:CorA family divalent cation transporter n=1 Tax=Vibrio natriegens TaxID=691 RepID=UPI000804627F|nr:CorA family divalent cation transporter [Vibrio natriegens]ANQ27147.1 magnesium transporter [Vibrio natriegens]MCY9877993.1 zinc transporter ZntB [Vibrio natriegens]